jgi:hypothetical protein
MFVVAVVMLFVTITPFMVIMLTAVIATAVMTFTVRDKIAGELTDWGAAPSIWPRVMGDRRPRACRC